MLAAPVSRTGTARARTRLLAACALSLCLSLVDAVGASVEWESAYTADILTNTRGGLRTATRYLDNFDLALTVASAVGSDALTGTLRVQGLYNNGTLFSTDVVGDTQVVSNIDAPEAWRLYQFWYEVRSSRWSAKAGLYDLNSEFDAHATGGLFLHSSHGIGADFGQTGRNGPGIFPVSALSFRAESELGRATARLAVLDGVPGDPENIASNEIRLSGEEGALIVAEFDVPAGASSRVWAGRWAYTARSGCAFDPGTCGGNNGWYIGGEGSLTRRDRDIGWFLRYGRANPDLNPFVDYVGAGLVLHGPFPGRQLDQLGIAVASAAAGEPYRRYLEGSGTGARSRETAWELAYRMALGDHLAIQPDIAYIDNPAATSGIGDALVLGLRIELTY